MGISIYKSKDNRILTTSSTHDNELVTVKDATTDKIKSIKTTLTPILEIKRQKGNLSLEVEITSTETDDKKLLHQLYKLAS